MKRYLQYGDTICTNNNNIYTVSYFDRKEKIVFTQEKNYRGESIMIHLSMIFGAIKN